MKLHFKEYYRCATFPCIYEVLICTLDMISGVWVIGFKTSIGSKEEIKEKDANRRWKAYQQHKNIEKWVDHRSDGSKKVSLNLLSGAFKLQLAMPKAAT
jgi:hypothetical protein